MLSPRIDRFGASHRRCAKDVAAPVARRVSAVRKVALPDQGRAEIFHFAKAKGHEFAVQRVRFKITLEGFSYGGDAGSKRFLSGGVSIPVETRSWGIAVIEHDLGAPWQACDELERRENGLLRQIRHDPQPSEERLLRRIEAGGSQAVRQSFPLEIDRGESKGVRQRDRRLSEPLALPRLRRRMIHLEDVQVFPEGVAIGVSVEARPEHHQLANTASDRSRQGILGKTRSYGNEQAQHPAGRIAFRIADRRFGVRPQYTHGQRVGEDAATLQHLVDSAMHSSCQRGAAWLSGLHRKSLGVWVIAVNWAQAAALCHFGFARFISTQEPIHALRMPG